MATGQFSRKIAQIDALLDELVAARGEYASLSAALAAKAGTDDISNLRTLLDSKIQYGTGVELTATQDNPIDLNTITTAGTYFATTGDLTYITNAPFAPNGTLNPIRLDVIALASGRRQQIVRPTGGSGDVFVRNNLSGTWGAWRNLNTFGLAQGIATGADLNDYIVPGVYYCNAATSSGLSNNPYMSGAIKLYVEYLNSDSRYIQKLIPSKSDTFQIFYRQYTDRGWGAWYLFEGTQVTPASTSGTNAVREDAYE